MPTAPCIIGFHASHEQLAPSALLTAVQRAEEAGFDAAMCSDHFAPWSERQGHSGFAWAWLAAALQATSLPFGVVTAPGQRYHPAITAQAIGTLAEMYPGRFWAALGSGELMNEHITGEPWPPKPERNARLAEAADVIKRMLAGEEVTFDGHIQVHRARLWTRPERTPPVLAAAVSAESAAELAAWADGLITLDHPGAKATIAAFRDAAGPDRPVYLQTHVAWAGDDHTALAIAFDQWRNGLVPSDQAWNLAFPEQFDAATADAQPEDVLSCVRVSADPGQHAAWLWELTELDVDGIFVHHVGRDQEPFIEAFGEQVLPRYRA